MRFVPLLAAALSAVLAACQPVPAPHISNAPPPAFRATPEQTAFADDLSQRTFRYFWDTTSPTTCLAPDRWPSAPFSSVAAIGFALTAYGVGAERGYVTREAAAARTAACLDYLYALPQGPQASGVAGHKGFFYHFLDFERGHRYRTVELSSVDTSLMLGGVLFAQSYFDRDTPTERRIRAAAERLYARVDWTFMLRPAGTPRAINLPSSQGLSMGWKPERGYEPHDWVGYNEGMLVYVLALGSPTHPVAKSAWDKGWMPGLADSWATYMGQTYATFEPLFGHQYSHVWIDFRGIREPFIASKGIDYFENSRRATYAQQEYGRRNPLGWTGYSADLWGWTASDGPENSDTRVVNGRVRTFQTYSARGVSPGVVRDDGTLVPTAPGGSIAFAPEIAFTTLMAMKARYPRVWDRYGFKDAFNPSFTFTTPPSRSGTVDPRSGWVANDYLGIDQGPILAMLENQRSELVWRTMRKNPHIRRGLERIGFTGGWLARRTS
ncbi:Tat pathway signal protein [Sphingomonas donggukensis]|uniref:Tat pathway signal protein n=1 Tax=Sphingomonas donggukensis TaxID=2949093 RepID=A0ABY4TT34_9SPHN|nr:glucoamylase family protein [Sphingomonas donggukensis]URW75483.1 Tat pathway signal protein [Sphingomonas donggukensis]